MMGKKLSWKKKILFSLVTFTMGMVIILFMGELMVRLLNPQVICDPRSNFSEKYGMIWPANQKINNELPGHWQFTYTTNRHHNRGPAFDISNKYPKPNIVVLGDSNTFGQGVNDMEEYPSIMSKHLQKNYNVINLANSGWGLTQEIRRFYDFGQLYLPKIVVLQFCENDPSDNYLFDVTYIVGNRFVFVNKPNKIGSFKKHLSNSIIQKSSLYNLVRVFIRRYVFKKTIRTNIQKQQQNTPGIESQTIQENFYNKLLEIFAKDLKSRGIKFIMISINNELDEYPLIRKKIAELEANNLLDYQETEEWFTHSESFNSPEGHRWGKKAHQIVGENLSKVILRNYQPHRSITKSKND